MNKVISIFITSVFLLTGCIKEDRSNCPSDFFHELYFIYTGDGNTDIFDSKIHSVNLYVFNEQGEYVSNYTYNQNQLESYQGARLQLPQGMYTVVGWGNITELSQITGDNDNLSNHRLFSTPYLQEEDIVNFDSLYYGKQIITIPKENLSVDTVYFRSSHINMEVYVQGLETTLTRAVNDPNGWIGVRNVYVGYDFNMEVTGDISDMFPDSTYDLTGDWLLSRFNLFRFKNDNNILIDIYNGEGRKVHTVNLKNFLATNNIDVERLNEITVPISVKFTGPTNVHVSVAEWDDEIVKPIF